MAIWILPPTEPFIEMVVAPEVVIERIGAIEFLDGWLRLYCCADERAVESPGAPTQRVLKLKILGSVANVPDVIEALHACLTFMEEQAPFPPIIGGGVVLRRVK